MSLSQLPLDFLRELIFLWNGLKEIVRLDTSNCHKGSRLNILEAMKNPKYALKIVHLSNDCGSWMQTHGIKTCRLSLKDQNIVNNLPMTYSNHSAGFVVDTSKVNSLAMKLIKPYKMQQENSSISHDGLINLLNGCPELSSLTLFAVKAFSDEVVLSILPSIVQQLCVLRLGYLKQKTLSDASLQYFSLHSPKLTSLSLFQVKHITFEGILSIIEKCTLLMKFELEIKNSMMIYNSDELMDAFVAHSPYLRILKISIEFDENTYSKMAELILKLPKLVEFVWDDCEPLEKCGNLFRYLCNVNKMKTLQIHVYDDGEVDIDGDAEFTTDLNTFFEQLGGFHNIIINSDEYLNQHTFDLIASKNPQLRRFTLTQCKHTCVKYSLRPILSKCRKMQELEISLLPKHAQILNSDLTLMFASYSNTLHFIEMRGLVNISLDVETMIAIFESNPQLSKFMLPETEFSDEDTDALNDYLDSECRWNADFIMKSGAEMEEEDEEEVEREKFNE